VMNGSTCLLMHVCTYKYGRMVMDVCGGTFKLKWNIGNDVCMHYCETDCSWQSFASISM
jgi:hypothetical protein